ncbi:LysR family transcriptional regulator [Streptomyces cucumeris]|uniref:LysR family transcriptional regulator n=1 Tax=Streptomyces cucumeris TaxID=2962890 RepID=UPI003D74DED5
MDLIRHLRLFIVVAEELHFSRAADLLGMAQPPLSQAVRRLEREVGVELFDRSARQVRLTAAGALLVEEARELLAREERLRAVMGRVRDGELGTLRAGVPPQTPARTLHALLSACAEEFPGLRIDLHEVDPAEQVRLLGSGGLDVGLVHHPVDDAGGLVLGPSADTALGVVLPRASRLARLPEVALHDLAGHDLFLFPRATAPGWYDRTLEICRAGGFVPPSVRHARNPEFLLGLVASGRGVAFDDGRVAGKEPRAAWRPLTGRPLILRISAIWPDHSAHPAVHHFARIAVRAIMDDLPARSDGSAAPAADERTRPWSVVYPPGRPTVP